MRRVELDTYLAIISDLALTYGGALFYEYHKSFSSKAAMYIQKFNQRIDWSVVDLNLISRHFTGHPPLTCSVCGSFSHSLTCVLRLHPTMCQAHPSIQDSGRPHHRNRCLMLQIALHQLYPI